MNNIEVNSIVNEAKAPLVLDDTLVLEGAVDAGFIDWCVSVQRSINAGNWGMQGDIGRTMMRALEAGQCLLGEDGHRDYWGNYIPSRHQVEAGTKGSYEYVVEHYGLDHANAMRGVV